MEMQNPPMHFQQAVHSIPASDLPHLAIFGIRQAQHCHLGNARMLQQRTLDVQCGDLQGTQGSSGYEQSS